MIEILTPRLAIRSFQESDASDHQRLSVEETTRYEMYDEACETVEDALNLIRKVRGNEATRSFPFALAIERRSDGALLGHVSLSPCDGEIEIGYSIAESERGHGYATEAADAFSAWALREGLAPRLLGVVRVGNAGSGRVLAKAGYRYEGTETRPCFGGVYPVMIYHRGPITA